MTALGPRTEAALEDGPQYVSRNWPDLEPFQSIEGEREFARRVALIAHAEGFAAGARAQREMEPTKEMLNASIAGMSFPQDFSIDYQGRAIARHREIFRAMQRVAPLAGEGR